MDDPQSRVLVVCIGAVISVRREFHGMTQTSLAEKAAIHPMSLSKIERAVGRDIGVVTVQKIAMAMCGPGRDVTAHGLLEQAEQWADHVMRYARDRSMDPASFDAAMVTGVVLGMADGAAKITPLC